MGEEGEFVIGYALPEKKQSSFLQESLVDRAAEHGLRFIALDLRRPLHLQGPFHAILHKLSSSSSWSAELSEFAQAHPHVLIVDPPSSIECLHDRVSMLQLVVDLQNAAPAPAPASSNGDEEASVQAPTQWVLHGEETEEEKLALLERLRFPVVVKPLLVDGSAKSHAMSLAFNAHGLAKLKPPAVLQEFINHGGVVFKVYVAGEHVQCVRRNSLPDVNLHELEDVREPVSFCQISNTSSSEYSGDSELQGIELPPNDFVLNVASRLRKALGLRLFNFDVIRDVRAIQRYYIIDINYFPGYAKLPNFESIMMDFLLSLREEHAMLA